ncbi:MAG: 50S ribosomal protein L3 [Verrucomicrobiota bacterium]|nr:50S ribosomal protein L3 [Verrucomicrobiota bacterium]
MSIGLLGRKVGMTRIYDSKGAMRAVTVLEAGPNVVLQTKTLEKEGYKAVQVGFLDSKENRVGKPAAGIAKKANTTPKKLVREFRVDKEELNPGDLITVTNFIVGQYVDIVGTSKGHGFQGVVKRHGFAGGGAAHGSKSHRRPGAIGERSTPGRIYKNHRMAGHMGQRQRTMQSLEILQVRETENLLVISGSVPGANGDYVIIRQAKKKPAAVATK